MATEGGCVDAATATAAPDAVFTLLGMWRWVYLAARWAETGAVAVVGMVASRWGAKKRALLLLLLLLLLTLSPREFLHEAAAASSMTEVTAVGA